MTLGHRKILGQLMTELPIRRFPSVPQNVTYRFAAADSFLLRKKLYLPDLKSTYTKRLSAASPLSRNEEYHKSRIFIYQTKLKVVHHFTYLGCNSLLIGLQQSRIDAFVALGDFKGTIAI